MTIKIDFKKHTAENKAVFEMAEAQYDLDKDAIDKMLSVWHVQPKAYPAIQIKKGDIFDFPAGKYQNHCEIVIWKLKVEDVTNDVASITFLSGSK